MDSNSFLEGSITESASLNWSFNDRMVNHWTKKSAPYHVQSAGHHNLPRAYLLVGGQLQNGRTWKQIKIMIFFR